MRIRDLETGASYRPEDLMSDVADALADGLMTEDEALQKLQPLAGGDPMRLQEIMGEVGVEISPEIANYFARSTPPKAN